MERWFQIVVGVIIVSPFIFVSSTKFLTIASACTIISVTVFVSITIYDASKSVQSENFEDMVYLPTFGPDFDYFETLLAFPGLLIVFVFQFNFFPVVHDLKNPTNKRMLQSAYLGTSFSLVMYLTMAFLGYLIYGEEILPNYLETVKVDNVGKFVFVVL